jgi:hypothetical protein
MYLTQVEVSGLRDLAQLQLPDLGRVVRVATPGPAVSALGDGIELVWAALDPARLQPLLRRWGLCGPAEEVLTHGDPLPDEAVWAQPANPRHHVDDATERAIQVRLHLSLDPVQRAQLRVDFARDPQLLSALAEGGPLLLTVGALFNRAFTALSLSMPPLRLSGVEVPVRGPERPPWVEPFLVSLRPRFLRAQPTWDPAPAALAAAFSTDHFDRYRAFCGALGPGGPSLRVALGAGGAPTLLADELPVRRLGERMVRRIAIAGQVHLLGADILWLEDEDPWVEAAVLGESSPIEQVLRVCEDGDRAVVPAPQRLGPPPLSTQNRRARGAS